MPGLCARGGGSAEKWQEQYDLGIRYLSEGNYEEAILAFTAAIEIDPKLPDAYLKAAEAYETAGNVEKAMEILAQGYGVTGAESLEEYRNTLELQQNPWPAMTTEQQELFHSLAAAAKNFDRAAVQEIVTSEEYYYFYEGFPLTRHYERDNTSSGGFSLTTEAGETYLFSYWSNPENNGELDFWFYVTEDVGYYRVAYWTPYMSETRNGSYAIGYWTGERGNENGSFKQLSWEHNYGLWHIVEGTALNGIRVGTETRTTEGFENASYIAEFDQEGNLIYQPDQVNEEGKVEFVQSNGKTRAVDPDHYPMDATSVAW